MEGSKKAPASKPAKVRKPAVISNATKAPVNARQAGSAAVRAARRTQRRLAGIRAAAVELGKALEDMESAREAIEGQFQKAAAANLTRARGALESLCRAAGEGPMVDVRRLERDLVSLVEACGQLRSRRTRGRKRDVLAVDDFLGEAARKLELSAAGAAAGNLQLLGERLVEMENLRTDLQKTVRERFSMRLEMSRAVLGSLETGAIRLNEVGLEAVSRELNGALAQSKVCQPGKLQGKLKDLYGIDGVSKQLARRLDKVSALLAVKKEGSDG